MLHYHEEDPRGFPEDYVLEKRGADSVRHEPTKYCTRRDYVRIRKYKNVEVRIGTSKYTVDTEYVNVVCVLYSRHEVSKSETVLAEVEVTTHR